MASDPVTYEIPKTFKAAVYGEYCPVKNLFKQLILLKDNPGHISTHVEELPVPEPGPGQVLVRLTVSFKITSQIPEARDTDRFPAFRRLPQ
jgi:propanol-preferring alcohol dehydrogenase